MTKRRIFYSSETRSKIRRRAASVVLLLTSGFALLVYRCLTLHVSPDPRLQRLMTNQYKARLQAARPRGSIYDRHGEEMAVSVPTYSLAVRPARLTAPRQLAISLSDALSLPRDELFSKISSDKKYVWIKRHLSPKEVDRLKTDEEEPGVEWVNESKRYYPNRELASQILGVVGTDGQGLGGLEQTYERFLDRHEKDSDTYQDARGHRLEIPEQVKKEPSGPLDIWLTLNKSIQFTVETELEQACRQYRAKSCTGIVIDPMSGDILAMATYPGFNPNLRSTSDRAAWKNRAITDGFEPGSTFKVIMAAAALESGIVRPQDRFFCENGLYPVASHMIHDSHPHGLLTFREILKVSSNIGMVKIGQRVGKPGFDRAMRDFGFGQKTGIDFPGEDSGTIRPASSWGEIEFANMTFGQGVRVTPLQILRAYSIIASGGYDVKPHFVSKVMTPAGGEVWRFQNSPKRILKSSTAETLTKMLTEVTEEGGTGTQAKLSAYSVAGKTGTAQKVENGKYSKQDFVASFVGFAPAGNPRVAVLVAIDEPRGEIYGGVVAAPVFRKIVWDSLRELGVAPEVPTGGMLEASMQPKVPLSIPAARATEASFSEEGVPDFRGLSIREVLRLVGERKIPTEIEGSGVVRFQRPAPGTKLAPGESCRIVLKNIQ
ncbi:MAG: transpeptidase family protein [Deltaproteobacteria bacterium]|nr:transpeptidase family protein [Deltaproteobacteria bacterium]